jgi:hypothetical protein
MTLTAVSGLTLTMEKVSALACPSCGKTVALAPTQDASRVLADGWAGRCCGAGIRVESLSPVQTLTTQRQYWVDVEPS